MKFFKYLLIFLATLGFVASVYNAIYKNSFSDFVEGLVTSGFLVILALKLKEIEGFIRSCRS